MSKQRKAAPVKKLEEDKHYELKVCKSFQELNKYFLEESELSQMNWMFRGHSSARYLLVTSFERALDQFGLSLFPEDKQNPIPSGDKKSALLALRGHDLSWLKDEQHKAAIFEWVKTYKANKNQVADDYEIQFIREFQRKAKNHFDPQALPSDREDCFQWLTFMQHFGAPTRLLDWTYSFYVALFFAIRNFKPTKGNQFCIWAMHQNRLDGVVLNHIWPRELLDMKFADRGDRKKEFMNYQIAYDSTRAKGNLIPEPSVVTMTPYEMNERLSVQQGTFVVPSFPSVSFEESLVSVLEKAVSISGEHKPGSIMKKLVCEFDAGEMRKTWEHLKRTNITAASLFPNEGANFAESVGHMLAIPAFRLAESKHRSV